MKRTHKDTANGQPAVKKVKPNESFLDITTVRDVLQKVKGTNTDARSPHYIVKLDHNMTVEAALAKLSSKNILSAPVVDLGSGSFMGFCDVADVLRNFFVYLERHKNTARTQVGQNVELLQVANQYLAETKVLQILGSDVSVVSSNMPNITVRSLIEDGFLGSTHLVHRLAVYDLHGTITNIISQSDIIKLLAISDKNKFQISNDDDSKQSDDGNKSLFDYTLEELKLASSSQSDSARPLSTVSDQETVIEAFKDMYNKKVSSVGVVDSNGKLSGCISASDFRGLAVEHLSQVILPVTLWLQSRKEGPKEVIHVDPTAPAQAIEDGHHGHGAKERKKPRQVVATTSHATLGTVINILARHRLHRIYICDEEQQPVSVVTLTDVLQTVLEKCK